MHCLFFNVQTLKKARRLKTDSLYILQQSKYTVNRYLPLFFPFLLICLDIAA